MASYDHFEVLHCGFNNQGHVGPVFVCLINEFVWYNKIFVNDFNRSFFMGNVLELTGSSQSGSSKSILLIHIKILKTTDFYSVVPPPFSKWRLNIPSHIFFHKTVVIMDSTIHLGVLFYGIDKTIYKQSFFIRKSCKYLDMSRYHKPCIFVCLNYRKDFVNVMSSQSWVWPSHFAY